MWREGKWKRKGKRRHEKGQSMNGRRWRKEKMDEEREREVNNKEMRKILKAREGKWKKMEN